MSNDREDAPPAGADDPTASRGADAGSRFSAFEGATEDFGIGPGGADPLIGADIGGVTIVRLIGQGGMGRVYEARQVKPSRPVAVKVIRPGVVSEAHMRRFDHEAEILARLRHPGIAQIHTVGTYHSPAGDVPFFVMEYIPDARTLVEFADHHRLSTHDRLELFRKVCDAVAHGHTRGVVHRDLKPSNILVDAAGQPKVIDFGVAKTTDVDLALTTMRTDVGQLIGTLQYMSPEQFDGQPDEVDVRSDVYALGVVLYELLAGQPPYDVRRKAVIEAARVVKEEDPAPLSSLNRTLRRDVGVIAGKCLAKAPGGRYSSAAELGADVGRYLAGEPIHASPPGFIDGVVRLARRHKAAAAAVGMVAASLVAAVVGISLFAEQAERQRQDATKSAELAEHKRNASDLNRFHLLQERGDFTNAFALLDDIERRFTPENIPVEVRVTRAEADDAIAVFPGRTCAFSPDGSLLAIGGASENETQPSQKMPRAHALLVDAYTARQIVCLEEPSGGCVDGPPRFSRDGARVAFATSDRELTNLYLNHDGHEFGLVSRGSRGASVWDVRTGRLCDSFENSLRPLEAPPYSLSSWLAVVNPDARRAVIVESLSLSGLRLRLHSGATVTHCDDIWLTDALISKRDFDDPELPIDQRFGLPVFDDSVSRAVITDGESVHLWDLERAAPIATLASPNLQEPILSPDGKRLLLCRREFLGELEIARFAELYDITSDALSWYGEGIHERSEWCVFTLWDTTTGQQLASFGIPDSVTFTDSSYRAKPTLAFSPDSEVLVIAGTSDGSSLLHGPNFIEVRSGKTGKLHARSWLENGKPKPARITQCVFSPTGGAFVVCREDGTAFPMERVEGEVFRPAPIELQESETVGDVACFSPDGMKIVFRQGEELRIYEKTQTPKGMPCYKPLARLRGRHRIGVPIFNSDASRLAATLGDRQIALWDTAELESRPFSHRPFAEGMKPDEGRWLYDFPLLASTNNSSTRLLAASPKPICIYRVTELGVEQTMAIPHDSELFTQQVPRGPGIAELTVDGLLLNGYDNSM